MGLNVVSNIFDGNIAENGGALYIMDDPNFNMDLNENRNIFFENNKFIRNIAHNFGGAIYSNYSRFYLANVDNNEIVCNKAGIMGGGLFSPKYVNKTSFSFKKITINNNTADSFEDNYSSKPFYVDLDTPFDNNNIKIMSGDRFPLSFTLYDEFYNIVKDITKYYSSLVLKVLLIIKDNDEYDEYDEYDSDYNYYESQKVHLTGNIGSFTYGN